MRRLRAAARSIGPAALAILGLIVVAGLVLRLRNNGYGLPYVYNVDEGSHFTSRAVAMFADDANPGYFQNPSAFTYLVHAVLRVQFGPIWPFGGYDDLIAQFKEDPTEIYKTARALAAVICMAGVVTVFAVGRRLWDTATGLVAAALLAFAFLAVAYSRIAVTDVGTLVPVALSVWISIRAYEDGGRSTFVLAGVAGGVAVGFKYTAGLVLLPLAIAAVARALRGDRRALLDGGLGALAALLAFAVTTPYFFLDFDTAERQIRAQAETAGEFDKLGQASESGFAYYLDSLTWGFGWLAALAALAGAAIVARRDRMRALLLVAFPIALFAYLSFQSRYFGRWLLPAYPVLALLAAVALVRVSRIAREGPARAAVLAALTFVVLLQPLAADFRTMRLLGRADTRQLARDFLVANHGSPLRIVIEPAVPARYYRLSRPGRRAPLSRKQFVRGFVRDIQETRVDYAATLRPATLDRYRDNGFCLVMTMSVIRGRAENDGDATSLSYYGALEEQSELIYSTSPYERGVKPPRFHFDLSYNYYPTQFARPGPEVRIYRLNDCVQGYGPIRRGAGTPERRRQTSSESGP